MALPACLLILAFAAFSALGQDTGGSMGGADFSSGGGGDSGGSSNDYDSSSGDSGESSAAGGGEGVGVVVVVGLVILFVVLAPFAKKSTAAGGPMFLSSLALGLDWHVRRELQRKLEQLALQKLGGTAEGRTKMLREVALALRRAELSWLYVDCQGRELASDTAEAAFVAKRDGARSRFRRELIRSEGSEVTIEPPGPRRIRPEEGPGTVVVSLILVTRRALTGWPGMTDAAEIRAALADRSAVASRDLVAIEVVWSPAAEDDRMSTSELEQHYPELVLIDPASIAGRIFCSYCGGAFAMELLSCPHCGAAVDQSA